MSTTTHTPGPWLIKGGDHIETTTGRRICTIDERDFGKGFAESYENGFLIAAAPDLLAALVEMLEFADMGEIHDEETAEAVARAHAAIAKAKGGQP